MESFIYGQAAVDWVSLLLSAVIQVVKDSITYFIDSLIFLMCNYLKNLTEEYCMNQSTHQLP